MATFPLAPGPSFESLQGRNPREVEARRFRALWRFSYGGDWAEAVEARGSCRLRAPDWLIGFERASRSRYLGDAPWLMGGAGHLSGRGAASPVDDQRGTHAMMREIVLALMRYRS